MSAPQVIFNIECSNSKEESKETIVNDDGTTSKNNARYSDLTYKGS